jgi:LacI family transcriptional regulator
MKVPEDISIIGFDNVSISQYSYPALSTITQPAFEKGVIAADMLVNYLHTKVRPESIMLPTELVIRQSTGPVKEER